jgi:hypothetical protein
MPWPVASCIPKWQIQEQRPNPETDCVDNGPWASSNHLLVERGLASKVETTVYSQKWMEIFHCRSIQKSSSAKDHDEMQLSQELDHFVS